MTRKNKNAALKQVIKEKEKTIKNLVRIVNKSPFDVKAYEGFYNKLRTLFLMEKTINDAN